MIYVRVYYGAGNTNGIPDFETSDRGSVVSDTFASKLYLIESGPFEGETLAETIAGTIDYLNAPYRATVSSYTLSIQEGTDDSVLLYRESYEDPIRIRPYWDTLELRDKADAYALEGVSFIGNRFDNVFAGYGGDDILEGGRGNDRLSGRDGNDTIQGGKGRDVAIGGRGNDSYLVEDARTRIVEQKGEGNDEVRSYVSVTLADNVEKLRLLNDFRDTDGTGNGLANVIRGDSVDNVLDGRGGADTLLGSWGSDVLIGGTGADRLTGGDDADIFRFGSAASAGTVARHDRITDMAAGIDRIDLKAIDADTTTAGNQAFTYIAAQAFSGTAGELNRDGNLVMGDTDGDGTADFAFDVRGAASLTAGDFVL